MTETAIQLAITGRLSYSDEISITQATRIIAYLNSQGSGVADELHLEDAPSGNQSERRSHKKVENPREALQESGASTNAEKIVTLAAYSLLDSDFETFKVEDVKSMFRRARETPPANFGRDLGTAVGAGWIFEADDVPGEYYLNSKVDSIFDGDFVFPKSSNGATGRQRSGSKRGPSKSKSRTAKPETLSDVDEFHPNLHGYPSYSILKSEKDRLLWIINYMSEKYDRKGLNNKEIAWISDHIGIGIPTDNISGAFRSAKRPGYAVRSTRDQTIKITSEGVAHLESLATES